MKHLHFFGCSYTVGDELADDEFFPWKKECRTGKEYYKKRNEIPNNDENYYNYTRACKRMAYPAQIESNDITTYNYAEVGASVRHNLFRLIAAVHDRKINPGHMVFLQLSPWPREVYMKEDGITSIQITVPENKPAYIKNYIENKIVSHNDYQFAAEDIMDIILTQGYLKSINVSLLLLEFDYFLKKRLDVLPDYYKFLIDELNKSVQVLNLSKVFKSLRYNTRLLGGHYTHHAHERIAEELKKYINGTEQHS